MILQTCNVCEIGACVLQSTSCALRRPWDISSLFWCRSKVGHAYPFLPSLRCTPLCNPHWSLYSAFDAPASLSSAFLLAILGWVLAPRHYAVISAISQIVDSSMSLTPAGQFWASTFEAMPHSSDCSALLSLPQLGFATMSVGQPQLVCVKRSVSIYLLYDIAKLLS